MKLGRIWNKAKLERLIDGQESRVRWSSVLFQLHLVCKTHLASWQEKRVVTTAILIISVCGAQSALQNHLKSAALCMRSAVLRCLTGCRPHVTCRSRTVDNPMSRKRLNISSESSAVQNSYACRHHIDCRCLISVQCVCAISKHTS